jgi:hypothetical protein
MAANASAMAATQYGAPIGEYRGGKANIFLIIIGVALLVAGALCALTAASSSAQGDASSAVGLAIVAVVFIAAAVYAFWTVFTWRGAHARLFERGFVLARAGKTMAARWEDIASVTAKVVRIRYNFIPVWTSHKYTVALANGETFLINNGFGKVGALGDAVQRMSANALLPRAIGAYNSGATLPFGRLSVNQAGISNGKETLPWSDLERVTFGNGLLLVMRKGKRLRWAYTPVRATPNVYVLVALVNYIQRGIR